MDNGQRVRREIAVNAAAVMGVPLEAIEVRTEACEEGGFEAVVSTDDDGGFQARGESEYAALWALLSEMIDRANGTHFSQRLVSQRLVMTPGLREALRLLTLSRLELIEAIRRELDGNPTK